ncbi:apolipoprotein N-acyltransferase [Noviherbaspirillum denitrificans]|uniref:Apolipoprotein N-acyltransferase n=1 Tax=Noviherbaspirillum denitrificans TaxID=1968433 RepID=A0A254TL09_9BURK|nr:apolipoprotein N-acyltransferase [Noviherbaspirillum denitrificans]OWW22002.1 apolipoprotein N-acyltransferase [Noviherbaspirillum denitrificans]
MTLRLPTTSQSPLTVLLALAAGASTVFAFAPFGLWPVQIATLALMFWLLNREAGFRHGALLGWAYGSGWLIAGVHWLYISMHRYGGLPSWMAILAVILLGTSLSVFMALGTGTAAWLKKRWSLGPTAFLLLVMPSVWALIEWTRGWIFTGFPWVSSGYAHTGSPLAGYAPLIGVYGIALVSALIAGCFALLPGKKLPLAGVTALLAAGLGLRGIEWTQPNGSPVSVRLLQGNVPQEMKFQPGQIEATLSLYHDMIVEKPADLIATPETAIPLLSTQLPPDFLSLLTDFSAKSKSHLILGIPVSDGPRQYSNSVLGMTPGAGNLYRYDKHHLVPFGEFIPPGFRWFVEMMHIPLGDFNSAGLLQAPFRVREQWVLPNICYEDLFGEEIASQLRASRDGKLPQATILLNVSNIAWFGDSIALPQHLQISQMRSIETGRPMLRSTNTGMTAVIGPKGDVTGQLHPFERGTLAANVQGYGGLTPYSQYGNIPVVAMAILLLAAARFLAFPKGKNQPNPLETR